MQTAIVIPARYGSRRLPGKPLLRTTGKYLIQHVYEQACQSRRHVSRPHVSGAVIRAKHLDTVCYH
jgi:CMP-2-keto-3-deoxyoctulosonic acid synthetase